jgi:hypothetical protein
MHPPLELKNDLKKEDMIQMKDIYRNGWGGDGKLVLQLIYHELGGEVGWGLRTGS